MPQVPQHPQLFAAEVHDLRGRGQVVPQGQLHSHLGTSISALHHHGKATTTEKLWLEGEVRPLDEPLLLCCHGLHGLQLHRHWHIAVSRRGKDDAAERSAHRARMPSGAHRRHVRLSHLLQADVVQVHLGRRRRRLSSRLTGKGPVLQRVLRRTAQDLLHRQVLVGLRYPQESRPILKLDPASAHQTHESADQQAQCQAQGSSIGAVLLRHAYGEGQVHDRHHEGQPEPHCSADGQNHIVDHNEACQVANGYSVGQDGGLGQLLVGILNVHVHQLCSPRSCGEHNRYSR
mmetsp:Transcript_37554/g.89654  ORF Transcript_37554/g.89654 Transcript_37554/m.89654 type:complete len:289 (-) Transcript_37554:438-1304(-)